MMNRFRGELRKADGFTLIELIIVLSIIGIILGIAVPGLARTMESAKVKADQASARTIVTAYHMALLDDDSRTDISLDYLNKEGYLDDVPKPQVKDKTSFVIVNKDNNIEVRYDSSTGEVVYPYKANKE